MRFGTWLWRKPQPACFVEYEPRKRKRHRTDPVIEEHPGVAVFVQMKRMGLSVDEVNLMTMNEFVIFSDIWAGEDPKVARKATQADIRSILG